MNHPYEEYERTPIWREIDAALEELERNRDIQLTTNREHFVGYMCKRLAAQGIVTEKSLTKSA